MLTKEITVSLGADFYHDDAGPKKLFLSKNT